MKSKLEDSLSLPMTLKLLHVTLKSRLRSLMVNDNEHLAKIYLYQTKVSIPLLSNVIGTVFIDQLTY